MKQNNIFNEYVEVFKMLPLNKKKQMVNDEMKKVWAFLMKLNQDIVFYRCEYCEPGNDSVR